MARMDADADATCDQAVRAVLSQVHPDHSIRDEVRHLLSTSLANTRIACAPELALSTAASLPTNSRRCSRILTAHFGIMG